MTIHIGFTGTRHGMTTAQRAHVVVLVDVHRGITTDLVAHHGDCVGADSQFHAIVRGCPGARIVLHPGPLSEHSAGCDGDERLPPAQPMRRNWAIVAASTIMIAAPLEHEPQRRGGTWATIRMAMKALRRDQLRALYVVGREGQLLEHGGWK